MTPTEPSELRVMSFNIWRSGGRSLEATIEAIRRSNADIVGLQECRVETADTIAKALKFGGVHDPHGHAILSRWPTMPIGSTTNPWGGLGATIQRDEKRRIHLFDAHLHYANYGPYALRGREAFGPAVPEILAQEQAIRMPGLVELLDMMAPFIASGEPTFLVGDFNAPSHLDYATIPWPESLLCYARGLADSYRVVHPAARTYPEAFAFDEPGVTWSPIVEEEPHGAYDRIDFIYWAGRLNPVSSVELDGRNCVDPWPSDHRAVLTTFI
jgi:endonuclease/exonuclease/phosphatase family metal-dependent hydrolase